MKINSIFINIIEYLISININTSSNKHYINLISTIYKVIVDKIHYSMSLIFSYQSSLIVQYAFRYYY